MKKITQIQDCQGNQGNMGLGIQIVLYIILIGKKSIVKSNLGPKQEVLCSCSRSDSASQWEVLVRSQDRMEVGCWDSSFLSAFAQCVAQISKHKFVEYGLNRILFLRRIYIWRSELCFHCLKNYIFHVSQVFSKHFKTHEKNTL